MKRREFLQTAAYGGLLLNLDTKAVRQEQKSPDLSLVQGESPRIITKKAVDQLGGMKEFVSRGDIVMIKPNIAFDRNPRQAGCTNPEVVGTLVEMCLDAGAKEVRMMDNPVHPARATYLNSGIADAVENAGGKVIYPGDGTIKSVEIGGDKIKKCRIFTEFIEVDKLINVPILKTHVLTKLTMGFKNWLGAVGSNRQNLHGGIEKNIVDLAAFFKPVLTVLDAYRIMARNGPDGGALSDVVTYKTVMAGRDPVALDALGAHTCQFKPMELGHLKIANKRGLGEMDLTKLKIDMRAVRG